MKKKIIFLCLIIFLSFFFIKNVKALSVGTSPASFSVDLNFLDDSIEEKLYLFNRNDFSVVYRFSVSDNIKDFVKVDETIRLEANENKLIYVKFLSNNKDFGDYRGIIELKLEVLEKDKDIFGAQLKVGYNLDTNINIASPTEKDKLYLEKLKKQNSSKIEENPLKKTDNFAKEEFPFFYLLLFLVLIAGISLYMAKQKKHL